jgi:hypothetical protein
MGMWQAAHSSSIDAPATGCSIVSRRMLACQYGSRDEFAMRLVRQSDAIETSSPAVLVSPL